MRFETFAHSYDQHARPQQFFAARVAEFARIESGCQIVELGAGTGELTERLSGIPGCQVSASDISPTMVRIGRERAPEATWSLLDAFKETPPSGLIQISSGLLQWAQNPVPVIRQWRAALGAGGRMIHAFPCEPCLREWRRIIPESPLEWRDERKWLALFQEAGMRALRKQVWVERCEFGSAFEMLRGLHRSGVTGAAQVPSGRLRRGIREYQERHGTGGGVVATWAWMAVEAVAAS